MKVNLFTLRLISLTLAVTLCSCSTVVSKTTGEGPVGNDKSNRSFGRLIDDQLIETYVGANIKKADEGFDAGNINIDSFNGIVLLTGQVKSDQLKQQATEIARNVRNVRRVHNELAIAGPISLPARTNDTWLKSKIKSRMLATAGVNPVRNKVVVENGVVYLMGIVSRAEADIAVDVAHKTFGVQKIVKVFEYTD